MSSCRRAISYITTTTAHSSITRYPTDTVMASFVFSANFVTESRATPKGSGGLMPLDSHRARVSANEQDPSTTVRDADRDAQRKRAMVVLSRIMRGDEDPALQIGLDDPAQERTQFPHWLEKGVGLLKALHDNFEWWCIRRIIWKQSGGVWRSDGWMWTPYDRSERWNMLDGSTASFAGGALGANAGHHIPEEILPRIVAFFVDMPLRDLVDYLEREPVAVQVIPSAPFSPSFLSRDLTGIKNIAQVSRAFFNICAPLLYSRIRIEASDLNDLCNSLRESRGHVFRCVRSLTLRGSDGMPWTQWSKLARLAPSVSQLHWYARGCDVGDSGSGHNRYHATQLLVAAVSCARFINVTHISICHSQFTHPCDALRILASFPALASARLDSPFSATKSPSRAMIPTPYKGHSRLRTLDLGRLSTGSSESLLRYWAWSHREDAHSGYFPGLRYNDVSVLTELVEAYKPIAVPHPSLPSLRSLRIDPLDTADRWLLSHRTGIASCLEIYVTSLPQSPGHLEGTKINTDVRHILIRIDQQIFVSIRPPKERRVEVWGMIMAPRFANIDKCLTRFPDLQSFVLEVDEESLECFSDLAQWMPMTAGRVQLRSYQDAHRLASQALKSEDGKETPISPFWYTPEYAGNRNELLHPSYGMSFFKSSLGAQNEYSIAQMVGQSTVRRLSYGLK